MNPTKWSRKAQIIVGTVAALWAIGTFAGSNQPETDAAPPAVSTVATTQAPTTQPSTTAVSAPTTAAAPVATEPPATTTVVVTTAAPTTVPVTVPVTTEAPTTTEAATTTTKVPTTVSTADIADIAAKVTWDGLGFEDQTNICQGYDLFGSDWVYTSVLEGITDGGVADTDDKTMALALVNVIQKKC